MKDFLQITIGSCLKEARIRKKISQAEIARQSRISRNQISLIEKNESRPTVETLLGYCSCLGMTPNEILGIGEKDKKEVVKEFEVLAESLNDEQQVALSAFLKTLKKDVKNKTVNG